MWFNIWHQFLCVDVCGSLTRSRDKLLIVSHLFMFNKQITQLVSQTLWCCLTSGSFVPSTPFEDRLSQTLSCHSYFGPHTFDAGGKSKTCGFQFKIFFALTFLGSSHTTNCWNDLAWATPCDFRWTNAGSKSNAFGVIDKRENSLSTSKNRSQIHYFALSSWYTNR